MASENMNKDDTAAKAKSVWSIVMAVVLGLAIIIVLFFLGSALLFYWGWSLQESIAQGGSDTLNDLGKMVIPYLTLLFK